MNGNLDLDAIEERANAASEAFASQGLGQGIVGDGRPGNGTTVDYDFELDGGFALHAFVERAAREDVPALVARVRELEAAVVRVRADLHLAEVLQSETAVEAALKALYLDHATDQIAPTAPEIAAACDRMARAALAAALAAVTNQEPGS